MLKAFFNTLCNRVDADQVPVTPGSTDGELGNLIILIMSDPPTRAEVQALPGACQDWGRQAWSAAAKCRQRLPPHSEPSRVSAEPANLRFTKGNWSAGGGAG